MATLIATYNESNVNANAVSYAGGSVPNIGETFTCPREMNLDSCAFWLKKVLLPTGNMVAKLYAHTGTYGTNGKPTGAPLATSDPISAATLGTSYAKKTFSFTGSNRYLMTAAEKYVIILDDSLVGDASNYVHIGYHNAGSWEGNYVYGNEANWQTNSLFDIAFYVYGTIDVIATVANFVISLKDIVLSALVWERDQKPTTTWTNENK